MEKNEHVDPEGGIRPKEEGGEAGDMIRADIAGYIGLPTMPGGYLMN